MNTRALALALTPTTNPNPVPGQVWGCAVQSGRLKLLRDAPRALVYLMPLYWAEVRVGLGLGLARLPTAALLGRGKGKG